MSLQSCMAVLLVFLSFYLNPRSGFATAQYNISTEALERFREALRLKSVCWGPGNYNKTALLLLHQHIKKSYPELHSSQRVSLRTISNYSLLYKVTGESGDDDAFRLPYLLMAHLDVVPVDDQEWLHDPFEASIHNHTIHARGTLDNKHNAFAILEAVEGLLKSGFHFKKTFYIFFGHDEECTGKEGAGVAAREMGVERLEWVLDEGNVVLKGVYPSITAPVAHVGVAEKGYLTLKLEVQMPGGHSSLPPLSYTIPVLAQAVARLAANPQKSMMGSGLEVDLFRELSKHVSFPLSWVYSHISWFSSIVENVFAGNIAFNAIIRSTTAITMFHAGVKDNIIPTTATAHVNHRIHTSQNSHEVIEHDRNVINDDRIIISIVESTSPVQASCFQSSSSSPPSSSSSSPSSSSSSAPCSGYSVLEQTIKEVWSGDEGVIVVPSLLTGMTDSRHFRHLADNIYRFSPVELKLGDLSMIHGNNEAISIAQYARMLSFYQRLIINADSSSSSSSSSSPFTHSPHHDGSL